MLIPLNSDLRLNRQPWVTWAVIVICLIVFYFQYQSNRKYENYIINYCENISTQSVTSASNLFTQDFSACGYLLHVYHIQTIRGINPEEIESTVFEDLTELPEDESLKLRLSLYEQYVHFKENVPKILDEEIMYFPRSFNPFTMISSSLAHGGFAHIIGNLIFFFAFSCAVELLVGGALRYVLTLTAIAMASSIFYSLFTLFEGGNIPGLGLSGVVMGVIGLSAYLMPKARINTLIWFILPITRVAIPAWFLAIWFVGFDAWELLSEGMNHGINLVAHVSGGVAGYLIGLWFFKQRKEDVAEELADEIKHMKGQRRDFTINSVANLNKSSKEFERYQDEKEEKRQQGAYYDRLYNMVRTSQNSEAINLILSDVDPIHLHPDHFLNFYNKVGEWKKHGAYLCLGRLLIDLYIQHQRYVDAFDIAKDCFKVTKDFVLANPRNVLILAQEANRQQRYKLAVALLHNAVSRYSTDVDYVSCGLLEADILIHKLEMPKIANQCLNQIKKIAGPSDAEKIASLQALVVPAS